MLGPPWEWYTCPPLCHSLAAASDGSPQAIRLNLAFRALPRLVQISLYIHVSSTFLFYVHLLNKMSQGLS